MFSGSAMVASSHSAIFSLSSSPNNKAVFLLLYCMLRPSFCVAIDVRFFLQKGNIEASLRQNTDYLIVLDF